VFVIILFWEVAPLHKTGGHFFLSGHLLFYRLVWSCPLYHLCCADLLLVSVCWTGDQKTIVSPCCCYLSMAPNFPP
jgi:hypothetical protein